MGHGPYGALESIGFPWDMDHMAHSRVLISHGSWTIQHTQGNVFPMGHGSYNTLESIGFPWVMDHTAHSRVLVSHQSLTMQESSYDPFTIYELSLFNQI